MSDHASPVGSQHHIVPVSKYLWTWLALIILMAATIVASEHQFSPIGNNLVALGIAMIKAVLVISIFMGVKYTTKLAKLWAIIGFAWLTLIGGILVDYASRVPIKGFSGDMGSALQAHESSFDQYSK